MNGTEARQYLTAESAYVQRISRMSRGALRDLLRADAAERGRIFIAGGPTTMSKNELIGALRQMHYPDADRMMAVHVAYHDQHGYTACNLCHDRDGTHAGHLCECDRWREVACTVCGAGVAFHFTTRHLPDARPILTDHGHSGHAYSGAMQVTA